MNRSKKRRKTLTGMFGKKDTTLCTPGSPGGSSKRRSTMTSPKVGMMCVGVGGRGLGEGAGVGVWML